MSSTVSLLKSGGGSAERGVSSAPVELSSVRCGLDSVLGEGLLRAGFDASSEKADKHGLQQKEQGGGAARPREPSRKDQEDTEGHASRYSSGGDGDGRQIVRGTPTIVALAVYPNQRTYAIFKERDVPFPGGSKVVGDDKLD